MFNSRITDFFKKHNLYDEEMFKYIYRQSDFVDYYNDPDMRAFIGSAFQCKKISNRLCKFRLCMPYAVDDKTTLMCIHEIIHGIDYYKHLNKRYKREKTIEVLPLLYEKIYVSEHSTPELINFANYLDSKIGDEIGDEYQIAYTIREELFNRYDKNYDKMSKLSDKLSRGGKIR